MPYTMLDAIKDEIEFLNELATIEESEKHIIAANACKLQARSLNRIVSRMENGYDYLIKNDKSKGKFAVFYRETNRKPLREEYPVLRKLAEQYDLFEALVQAEQCTTK